jgi:hypothetical protein
VTGAPTRSRPGVVAATPRPLPPYRDVFPPAADDLPRLASRDDRLTKEHT